MANVSVMYLGYAALPPPPVGPGGALPVMPPPSQPPIAYAEQSCDFDSLCDGVSLRGSASLVESSGASGHLRLTEATFHQNGFVIFDPATVNSIESLSVSMRLYISVRDGADGVGIVFGRETNAGIEWDRATLNDDGIAWGFSTYRATSTVARWTPGGWTHEILDSVTLTSAAMASLVPGWIRIWLTYRDSALTVTVGGMTLHSQVNVGSIDRAALSSWRVFIGARTGNLFAEHRLDDATVAYNGCILGADCVSPSLPPAPSLPPPGRPPSPPPPRRDSHAISGSELLQVLQRDEDKGQPLRVTMGVGEHTLESAACFDNHTGASEVRIKLLRVTRCSNPLPVETRK